MKKLIFIITAFAILFIPMNAEASLTSNEDDTPQVYYLKAEVLRVETITFEQDDSLAIDQIRQINDIMILQGEFTERVYTIENSVKFSDPQQLILHVGDKVMLSAELTEDGSEIKNIHIYDYYRIDSLIIFIIITAIILLGIAWLKGLRTIITIGFTAAGLLFYFVPLMLNGHSAALLMIPLCFIVAVINTTWDAGFNIRGLSSMIGTTFGVAVAGIFGFIMENQAKLTGLGETELNMLYYLPNHLALNYNSLMTACVMLIALGAIIDVCVDMVSEMSMMKESNPYITRKKLFFFGMKSGRGYMSRNINTIFFVIVACMIPIWVLFEGYNTPFVELINMDVLSIQLFRAMAAISGVVISMPVTAYIFTILSKRKSLY